MNVAALMALVAFTLVTGIVALVTLDRAQTGATEARRRALLTAGGDRISPSRRFIQQALVRTPLGRSVDDRLTRAGRNDLLAGEVLLGALLLVGLLVFLATRIVTPIAALVIGLGALAAMNAYLNTMVARRAAAFANQLPDIARVMSNAASAGMALPNALALTAREMEEPARGLLRLAVRQMEVGQNLAGAMAHLQDKAPSRELAVLVSTLVIQQRSGGDVIEALREMSDNLEQRRDLRREVETTMSGTRFSAYAVMGLGVATLGILELISPGSLRRVTASPIGLAAILISGALYLVGYLAVRRLSQVEV